MKKGLRDEGGVWAWPCVDCHAVVALSDAEAARLCEWLEAGYELNQVKRRCLECSYKHHPPTTKEGVQISSS